MSDIQKITSSHLTRVAVVYLRQSSAAQVEHNRESSLGNCFKGRQFTAEAILWPCDGI
jgi:hypothetical protein